MKGALDICKEDLQFFRGTIYYEICYQGRLVPNRVINVHVFVDEYWDGDLIAEYLQVGMCSTYLEELSIG